MNMPHHGAAEKIMAHLSRASVEQTLGQLLLDAGKLTPQDAERVLRLQQEEKLRFGEAAITLGLITQDDLRQALARQFE